jgi:hypothetical protein
LTPDVRPQADRFRGLSSDFVHMIGKPLRHGDFLCQNAFASRFRLACGLSWLTNL